MTDTSQPMSPLRGRMIEDMTVRNLSSAPQRSYPHAVRKFSRYFGRSPDRLDIEDVRAFQVHLVSQGISWPPLNQTVCAPRFFYGVATNRPEIPERIPYAREPRKLPVILGADEVVRFLDCGPGLKYKAALTTALSPHVLELLRLWWKMAQPTSWLFPGGQPHHPDQRAPAQPALPAPQLCEASSGERGRYPHHPGHSGAQQPVDDGPVHPGGGNGVPERGRALSHVVPGSSRTPQDHRRRSQIWVRNPVSSPFSIRGDGR